MIYIILPTHKKVKATEQFLQSISLHLNEKYKTIIIDDDIEHETSKSIKKKTNITILKGNGNLWWGGAINLGIDHLLTKIKPRDDDICIFANNDVVINNKTFKQIAHFLKYNKPALYHPRVFDENEKEISAGARVITWFPYISKHPKNFSENRKRIDLAPARFLCFKVSTLKKIRKINKNLPHYGGDNDFSLRAKKLGILTYIVQDACCFLDNRDTGLNSNRINKFSALLKSFIIVRSANNFKYRYRFLNNYFKNPLISITILFSMIFNMLLKFIKNKLV